MDRHHRAIATDARTPQPVYSVVRQPTALRHECESPPFTFVEVELLGRYSNHDIMTHLRQVLAGQKPGRPPARTTRSLRKKQVQHRLEPDEIDQLLKRYRAGTKISDLATEFSVSRTTVMKHVERAGAPRRRNLIRDHLDEARRLYDQGWSLARVADHFGVDPGTVGYTFRKASIPRRDTHGR